MSSEYVETGLHTLASIIVPIYNVENYIERCIGSILEQTYHNIELILVDDGSTDKSGLLCDKYKDDNRVIIHHQLNKGVSAARNKGIELSSGDYILFADADDWLANTMIESMVTAINITNAQIAVCNYYNVTGIDGNLKLEKNDLWPSTKSDTVLDKNDFCYKVYAKSATLWNKMFKRDIIEGITFDEDIDYGEDMLFLTKCLSRVERAVEVPTYGYYYYRGRSGNVVSSSIDSRSLRYIQASIRAFYYLKQIGYPDLGILRICFCYNQVLSRVPHSDRNNKKNEFVIASKEAACTPRLHDVRVFLESSHCSLSAKSSYILFRYFPRLWSIIKKI